MDTLDLSFLSDKERRKIQAVLERDAQIQKKEEQRLERLRNKAEKTKNPIILKKIRMRSGQWFSDVQSNSKFKRRGVDTVRQSIRLAKSRRGSRVDLSTISPVPTPPTPQPAEPPSRLAPPPAALAPVIEQEQALGGDGSSTQANHIEAEVPPCESHLPSNSIAKDKEADTPQPPEAGAEPKEEPTAEKSKEAKNEEESASDTLQATQQVAEEKKEEKATQEQPVAADEEKPQTSPKKEPAKSQGSPSRTWGTLNILSDIGIFRSSAPAPEEAAAKEPAAVEEKAEEKEVVVVVEESQQQQQEEQKAIEVATSDLETANDNLSPSHIATDQGSAVSLDDASPPEVAPSSPQVQVQLTETDAPSPAPAPAASPEKKDQQPSAADGGSHRQRYEQKRPDNHNQPSLLRPKTSGGRKVRLSKSRRARKPIPASFDAPPLADEDRYGHH